MGIFIDGVNGEGVRNITFYFQNELFGLPVDRTFFGIQYGAFVNYRHRGSVPADKITVIAEFFYLSEGDYCALKLHFSGKNRVIGDGETVNSQLPAAGSTLMLQSGKVVLYTGSEKPENNLITVPDLSGFGAETANAKLISLGFNVAIDGLLENSAQVTGQYPEPGEELPEGSLVTIKVRSLSGTE